MTEPLHLTPEEITDLTGKIKHKAQIRALRAMGFEVKARPDGLPRVARQHYYMVMGVTKGQNKSAANEPNWDALDDS